MTNTETPTAVVQRMFAAFGAGDLDALLETVHPDSRWTYYGANPRLSAAKFTGHAEWSHRGDAGVQPAGRAARLTAPDSRD